MARQGAMAGVTIGALLAAGARPAGAAIRFVDQSATGAANGTSWSNAFTDVQAALAIAVAGDEIRVAAGVYRPDGGSGARTATFALRNGVSVRGGFAGFGAPNPGAHDPAEFVTVLSGDLGAPGETADNCYHVVTGSGVGATAVLDGFTISGGNANGAFPHDVGGGLIASNGVPTLRDCTFSDNVALNAGGAVYVSGSGSMELTRCRFTSNTATNSGGAVACFFGSPTFSQCAFSGNVSFNSGGALSLFISDAEVVNSTFDSNSGELFGGAVYVLSGAPEFRDCGFRDNVTLNDSGAAADGGAALYNDSGSPGILRCLFVDNLTSDDGGAVYSRGGAPVVRGCSFLGNLAGDNGGAIFSENRSGPLSDCQFSGNTAFKSGGAMFESGGNPQIVGSTFSRNAAFLSAGGVGYASAALTLRNTILWNNSVMGSMTEAAQIGGAGPLPTMLFCCVQEWTGTLPGTGNIALNPEFVSATGGDGIAGTEDDDLHLRRTSPCLNGGDPLHAPDGEEVDLDGEPRVMGCQIDIGADEFTAGQGGTGDMNGDGQVDAADLQRFVDTLLGFGTPADPCVADVATDGVLDAADAAAFGEILTSGVSPLSPPTHEFAAGP